MACCMRFRRRREECRDPRRRRSTGQCDPEWAGGAALMTTAPPDERSEPRPSRSVVLLRPVPGTSAIHQLWAGTKLLAVGAISVLLTFYPGWIAIGLVAGLVLTAARIAHIPRGALPTVPHWLWILLALGGMSAAFAGGGPTIDVAGVPIGLGGLAELLRGPTSFFLVRRE